MAASRGTSATASGGGIAPSQPASATITKSTAVVPVIQTRPIWTAGSTIKHQVVVGEWLWQMPVVMGTDPTKVVSKANAKLPNPAQISPNTTITVQISEVPENLWARPVGTLTVQLEIHGIHRTEIQRRPTVLQMVNSNTLTVGSVSGAAFNSAGGTPTHPTWIPHQFCCGSTSAHKPALLLRGIAPIHYVFEREQGR